MGEKPKNIWEAAVAKYRDFKWRRITLPARDRREAREQKRIKAYREELMSLDSEAVLGAILETRRMQGLGVFTEEQISNLTSGAFMPAVIPHSRMIGPEEHYETYQAFWSTVRRGQVIYRPFIFRDPNTGVIWERINEIGYFMAYVDLKIVAATYLYYIDLHGKMQEYAGAASGHSSNIWRILDESAEKGS